MLYLYFPVHAPKTPPVLLCHQTPITTYQNLFILKTENYQSLKLGFQDKMIMENLKYKWPCIWTLYMENKCLHLKDGDVASYVSSRGRLLLSFYLFIFIWLCQVLAVGWSLVMACRIVPWPGYLWWECIVLAMGQPGKSLSDLVLSSREQTCILFFLLCSRRACQLDFLFAFIVLNFKC